MRNPYVSATRTYWRPNFLFGLAVMVFCVWFFQEHLKHEHEIRMRMNRLTHDSSIRHPLFEPLTMFAMMPLMYLAAVQVSHLKDMLGNPTSRLMPGVKRAHLAIASVNVGILTIVIPIVLVIAFDVSEQWLGMVASSVAAFAIAAVVSNWYPNSGFSFAMIAYLFLVYVGYTVLGHRPSPSISPAINVVLLIFAGACLTPLALRLTRLNEEMPEYGKRMQESFTWRGRSVTTAATSVGGWNRLIPLSLPHDFRAYGRSDDLASENVIQRARRWHAAWQTVQGALLNGLFMGCLIGVVVGWLVDERYPLETLVGSPSFPYLAVFPVLRVLSLQNRRYLQTELMQPQSRAEQMRAVGAALAMAVVVCWLSMLLVASVAWSITARTESPSIGRILSSIAFSLCCLPVTFGAASWPYRSSIAYTLYFALYGVMGSFAFLYPLNITGITKFAPLILALGLFVTYNSYKRWLEIDFE